MPAARAQIEKAAANRCRVREPREIPAKLTAPYTDEEIELFAFRLGVALSKPGAFDPICDRIDELLKKARVRR
jgi:hypothetical protein